MEQEDKATKGSRSNFREEKLGTQSEIWDQEDSFSSLAVEPTRNPFIREAANEKTEIRMNFISSTN